MPVRAFDEHYSRACDLESLTLTLLQLATGDLPKFAVEDSSPALTVLESFVSDGANKVNIPTNTVGHIIEVDADGDARMKFQGFAHPLWVLKRNFKNVDGLEKCVRDVHLEMRRDPEHVSRYAAASLSASPGLSHALVAMFL
jgi:hypothetical protein